MEAVKGNYLAECKVMVDNGLMLEPDGNAMDRLRGMCRENGINFKFIDCRYKNSLLFLKEYSLILCFKNVTTKDVNKFLELEFETS